MNLRDFLSFCCQVHSTANGIKVFGYKKWPRKVTSYAGSTNLPTTKPKAFALVSHQMELDHFAEVIQRGLEEAPGTLVVGHVGHSPIQRPTCLPLETSFMVVPFLSPLVGDIVDPQSQSQISRMLKRLVDALGGIDTFFFSGQYGWRGLYFRSGGDYPDARKIFVPEGIGVLANDTYRNLEFLPSLRAHLGNLFDEMRGEFKPRHLALSLYRLITKLSAFTVVRRHYSFGGMPYCDVVYSFWGPISLPDILTNEQIAVKPQKASAELKRRHTNGWLLLHSPLPNPRTFWSAVLEELAQRGVTRLHIAPHPTRTGYTALLAAASMTKSIEIREVDSPGPIENHLLHNQYDSVVGVASTAMVFLAANFPHDVVICLTSFEILGRKPLLAQHNQFFDEILPRIEGAQVLKF